LSCYLKSELVEWRSALVKSSVLHWHPLSEAEAGSEIIFYQRTEAKKTTVLLAIHRLAAGSIFTATDHLLVCYNEQQPSY